LSGEADGDVAVLIGTRPEAIKLMPVVRALERSGAAPAVYVTGQHRELLAPILADLALVPAEDLGVMQPNQALADLSARLLSAVQALLRRRRPGTLVVQGDTTSVAMGALAAFYEDVRVAHVEAGLRTGSRRNPFPEEMNRRLVGSIADLHFAPTPRARENLLAEIRSISSATRSSTRCSTRAIISCHGSLPTRRRSRCSARRARWCW
jgi:UDP-N-acetylglucosamine 2-epimerase (non-hydrolysing)